MAQSKDFQKRVYPLPVYNFQVTLGGTAMSFVEVSGIAVEYETVTYRHGLSFAEGEQIQSFHFDSFVPVTLRRGTILGSEPLALHSWLQQRDLRSLEVSLCDEAGLPQISWRIAKALPVRLDAPCFDAGASEVSIERLELRARGVSLVEH
ncbi:MAG: phage tail protein [Acidobacteriota bacterium]